jgi:hypothetical protein
MKNSKKHLKYLFLLTMLLFVGVLGTPSQPTHFPTFRLADSCQPYLGSEFVFVGSVISLEKLNDYSSKALIDVETPIKGELEGRIEVILNSGGRFISRRAVFTAHADKSDPQKLYSDRWSEPISEEFGKKELNDLIAKIRSVTKGEKQPRIVGEVQRQLDFEVSDDYRLWLKSPNIGTRSDGVLVTLPKNYSRFDTPPNYYRPFPEAAVEAKRADGKRFTVKTDADGKYEFKELPNGKYEVRPVLNDEFTVSTFFDDLIYHIYSGQPKTSASVEIDDTICSKNVDFKASVAGSLRVHLSNLTKDQLGSPYYPFINVALYKIDKSGFRDLYKPIENRVEKFTSTQTGSTIAIDFLIRGIPIGKYTLGVYPFYYPGVTDINQADVIEIKTNATTNINYKIPSSPKNN